MMEFAYRERRCDRCGKEFLINGADWAYRANEGKSAKIFCSWRCLRAWETEKPTKIDRRERIINAIMMHPDKTYNQIAKELGEVPKTVWYWQQKLNKQGVL